MSVVADRLVIVDLADEAAQLREQIASLEAYREIARAAIAELASTNREREYLRRRVAVLCDELRAQRDGEARVA